MAVSPRRTNLAPGSAGPFERRRSRSGHPLSEAEDDRNRMNEERGTKHMQANHLHEKTRLGPVHLKVSELDRSVRFYGEVVGLRELHRASGRAVLTVGGDESPLVVLHELPNAIVMPRRTTAGLYHFALLVPNRGALGLSLRHLLTCGIHVGHSDHLVSEALYIQDPDNNGIEIYADRPRETWRRDESGRYVITTDPLDLDGLLEEAGDSPWEGLPAGTSIGHIHFHVSDLLEARRFYIETLGFDLMASRDSAMFVSAGGYHHHVGLNTWAGVGAPAAADDAAGLAYYTLVAPTPEELERTTARLRQAGIALEQDGKAWFARDPFGITVRLTSEEAIPKG